MPAPALKSLAVKSHTKMGRAEHLWNKAKEIVSKEYGFKHSDPHFWALVMGITKRMMGLRESDKITFKSFISEDMTSSEYVDHVVANYNRLGKNFKAEEVPVEHKQTEDYSDKKQCYNNSFRYMLLENSKAKYVLGFVFYHEVPIEHAWIEENGKYYDLTLNPAGYDKYIKVAEFPFKDVNKFVVTSS